MLVRIEGFICRGVAAAPDPTSPMAITTSTWPYKVETVNETYWVQFPGTLPRSPGGSMVGSYPLPRQ